LEWYACFDVYATCTYTCCMRHVYVSPFESWLHRWKSESVCMTEYVCDKRACVCERECVRQIRECTRESVRRRDMRECVCERERAKQRVREGEKAREREKVGWWWWGAERERKRERKRTRERKRERESLCSRGGFTGRPDRLEWTMKHTLDDPSAWS